VQARLGDGVATDAILARDLHQAGHAEDAKLLGDEGGAQAELFGELPNPEVTLAEQPDDLEPDWVREGLEHLGQGLGVSIVDEGIGHGTTSWLLLSQYLDLPISLCILDHLHGRKIFFAPLRGPEPG
jgi:hypothetical protein